MDTIIKNTRTSMINSRIEVVDNPELNRKLFAFYERMINPFKEVETLYEKIDVDLEAIKQSRLLRKTVFIPCG